MVSYPKPHWEQVLKSQQVHIYLSDIYELIIQSPRLWTLVGRWLVNKLTVLLRGCGNCPTPSLYDMQEDFLSNIVHISNVGSMLGQRRNRRSSIKTALDLCLVWVVSCNQFSGYIYAVNLYSIGYCWPTLDRPRHAHFAVEWFFNFTSLVLREHLNTCIVWSTCGLPSVEVLKCAFADIRRQNLTSIDVKIWRL